jgi:hypothetical protein
MVSPALTELEKGKRWPFSIGSPTRWSAGLVLLAWVIVEIPNRIIANSCFIARSPRTGT